VWATSAAGSGRVDEVSRSRRGGTAAHRVGEDQGQRSGRRERHPADATPICFYKVLRFAGGGRAALVLFASE